MFETTVVESRVGHSSRARTMTLPVSVGLHAAIVGGAMLASAWSVAMPSASPPQFKPFVMQALPRIPEPVRVEPPRTPEPQPQPQVRVDGPPAGPVVDAPPAQIPPDIPILEQGQATGPITGPVQWNWDGTARDTRDQGDDFGLSVQTGPRVAGVGGVTRPAITRRVEPVYPPLLAKIGLEGSAVVECIVDEDGRITSATVATATHALFGEAARKAVLQWRFSPGMLNGEPVPTIFQLTVDFRTKR
jgi:periplasmic protein TonB